MSDFVTVPELQFFTYKVVSENIEHECLLPVPFDRLRALLLCDTKTVGGLFLVQLGLLLAKIVSRVLSLSKHLLDESIARVQSLSKRSLDGTNKLMNKSCMYILECSDGSYYTGSTRNIEQRFAQHQSGKGSKYTSTRLPVELVCVEEYERIDEAYAREIQVQGWSRKKKEALINSEYEKLPELSRNYASTGSAQVLVATGSAQGIRQAQYRAFDKKLKDKK